MKHEIKTLIDDNNEEVFEALSEINDQYGPNGQDGVSYQWVLDTYKKATAQIIDACNSEIITQIPLKNQREIYNSLKEIISNSIDIKNHGYPDVNKGGTYIRTQFIGFYQSICTNTLVLESLVDEARFYERITHHASNEKEIRDLSNAIAQYTTVLGKIVEVDKLHEGITAKSNDIESINTKAKDFEETINIHRNNFNAAVAKLNEQEEITESLLDQIKENNQEVENRKVQIVAFYKNIEDFKNDMEETTTQIKEFEEEKTKDFAAEIEKMNKKNEVLYERNLEYQRIIDEILQKANASNLVETFDSKARAIQRESYAWLVVIFLTFVAVCVISVYDFSFMKSEIMINKILQRAILIIPICLFDGFLIFQYSKRQRLIEEYQFKSSISASLFAFNDLVKANKEEDISKEFVIESIRKIYDSPFKIEEGLDKQQRVLLDKLLQGAGEKAGKAADALIGKIK